MAIWLSIFIIFFTYYSLLPTMNSLNDQGHSLLTLKKSITQNRRNSMANWNTSDPNPCSWKGIKCLEDSVVSIAIANQNLAGTLPPVFSNLSTLRHLNLRNNEFSGSLPADLFTVKGLQSLVLSGNSFSGSIPPEIGNLVSLQILDLSKNSFVGSIPRAMVRCKRLKVVDLSDNGFSDFLPAGLGNSLLELETLNVSFNRFTGSIPEDLGNLSKLIEPLDLSHNFFNGGIPPTLGNLPARIYVDLSYNNLSGRIPEIGTFLDSGPTAFIGNRLLCGLPLESPCRRNTRQNKDSDHVEQSGGKGIWIIVITAAMVGSCFLGWVVSRCLNKTTSHRHDQKNDDGDDIAKVTSSEKMDPYCFVLLDRRMSFDLEKLLNAPAYLLGESGIGTVYRVVLEDGKSVVVRRLGEGRRPSQGRRQFQNEVEGIAKMKHRNIVRLKAYCWSEDDNLLIYDFVPNKDLATAIHGTGRSHPLSWASRLRIIKGIAKGLTYIHEFSPKKYIHGDLNPRSILLGTNSEPYISDFGLATITGESSRLPTTPGKISPENLRSYYQSPEATVISATKPTQKWDVYAFGMILLEIVTGKFPVVEMGHLRLDLAVWVEQSLKDKAPIWYVVDPCLVDDLDRVGEMEGVIRVSLDCLQKSPERRPSMGIVLDKLEQIQ